MERRKIRLKDHIKEVGEYEVVVKLHREVSPAIKIKVRKEGAQEKAEAQAAVAAAESAPAEEPAEQPATAPAEDETEE